MKEKAAKDIAVKFYWDQYQHMYDVPSKYKEATKGQKSRFDSEFGTDVDELEKQIFDFANQMCKKHRNN